MRRSKCSGGQTPSFDPGTCVPTAYLDPGVDPSSVDFRNFFAYIPNEVKHRKRTTRDQAKVLETVFDRNTKPDSILRQRLANELGMSARGVQVWFQNRRAKEKSIGKKAVAARASSSTAPSLHSSSSPQDQPSKGTEDQDDEVSPPGSSSPSPETSPARKAHLTIPPETNGSTSNSNKNLQNISPEIPNYPVQHPGPPQASPDIYSTRRGSLPTIIQPQPTMPWATPGRSPAMNILARRGSAERLGVNPFARFLMARSARVGPYQPRPTSLRESHDQASLLRRHHHDDITAGPPFFNDPAGTTATAPADHFEARSALLALDAVATASSSLPAVPRPMMLGQRASMPHVFTGAHLPRRSSMPTDSLVYPPAPMHVSLTMPDNHMYAISSRTIPSPIPGPLPCPNFSFGHPVDTPLGSSSPAPAEPGSEGGRGSYIPQPSELQSYSFGRRDDNDTEDDATEASYDALSRFGSITSVAGSESSNTSAYYSDVGSCNELPSGWYPDARRGSYSSSGQFLDLLSDLDLGQGRHESDEGENPPDEFPSPSSTVSPGNSPSEFPTSTSANIPISASSELAHALQPKDDRGWDGTHSSNFTKSAIVTDMKTDEGPAQYDTYTQRSVMPVLLYPPSDSSSSSTSSLNVPVISKGHQEAMYQNHNISINDTGQFDPSYQNNSHVQPQAHAQSHTLSADGHYSTTGSNAPHHGQEFLELHHAMEYRNPGYVSGSIDMADVTSVIEKACETYFQYP